MSDSKACSVQSAPGGLAVARLLAVTVIGAIVAIGSWLVHLLNGAHQ